MRRGGRKDGEPMAAASPPMPLRAMDLSDILDEAFRIYRSRFALFASAGVLLVLPQLIISYLGGQFDQVGFFVSLITNPSGLQSPAPAGNALFTLLTYPVALLMAPLTLGLVP